MAILSDYQIGYELGLEHTESTPMPTSIDWTDAFMSGYVDGMADRCLDTFDSSTLVLDDDDISNDEFFSI